MLDNGYGVVIGTVVSHSIEPVDDQGLWPHYVINVNTPQGIYECVINLKSRSDVKIEQRDFREQDENHFQSILGLPDGFNSLQSNNTSGALDFIRHAGLKDKSCGWFRFWPFWPFVHHFKWRWKWWWRCKCKCTAWRPENGANIIQLFEYYLLNVDKIYIFGEPYNDGSLGMHNVHMNQGDPVGSGFDQENAIWQDGGLLIKYTGSDLRLSAFLTKFDTQSLNTDSNGHPN